MPLLTCPTMRPYSSMSLTMSLLCSRPSNYSYGPLCVRSHGRVSELCSVSNHTAVCLSCVLCPITRPVSELCSVSNHTAVCLSCVLCPITRPVSELCSVSNHTACVRVVFCVQSHGLCPSCVLLPFTNNLEVVPNGSLYLHHNFEVTRCFFMRHPDVHARSQHPDVYTH
jgi:hypothetical protein